MQGSLSVYLKDHNNNFNLLRVIAASMVLVGHCWPLTGHFDGADLSAVLGIDIAHVAVDIFFAISGFLVTGSLLARRNFLAFSFARILRIFPGLIVSCLVCVFIIGWYFTNLSSYDYFHSLRTYQYILNNATLIGIQFDIPGVFENLRYARSINGPLWTLPYEFNMYLILAGLGFFAYVWPRLLPDKAVHVAVVLIGILATTGFLFISYGQPSPPALSIFSNDTWRFTSMFFLSGSFYVLRDVIPVRRYLLDLVIVLIFLSRVFYVNDAHTVSFFVGAYSILLPYLILYLAFAHNSFIKKYNNLGDYSYGIYIYAFPIQQSVSSLFPDSTPLQMFCYAFPATLCVAILSWHFIEKPILEKKSLYKPVQAWLSRVFSKRQLKNAHA